MPDDLDTLTKDEIIAKLLEENREFQALFDLQWTRMQEATELWRQGHPDRESVQPDLGQLLEWLIKEREAYAIGYNSLKEQMRRKNPNLLRLGMIFAQGLLRSVAKTECEVPPKGWRCTRSAGHTGPCAAVYDTIP